ncbi:zf-DHHC-domain-containing protein [Radiomyces spectabilis]|uniref:zf-DHHC-domain-containing protein n=1 Tax=Radiomyces spectabilis TaxID=64574 RepID=UPI002220ACDF|nr:zf-DHHC-domain-containing protein [Radiomyces spectabilis]KAI8393351.1 zf-DHHC-domain-containing protein [Radiomyces spectabilis]
MFNQVPGRWIVIGVTTLITFLAVTAQWFILLPFFAGMDSMLTAKTLIPLNIGLCMIYINYYLACTVDPGEVPATWEPPYAVLEEHAPQGLTGPRFCKTCQVYKPPRAHHCRYCQRCILKMDHHCPWINNCVGHDNYGHFLRFVFWVDVTCSYALSLLIWRMYAMMDSNRLDWDFMQPTLFETVFLIVDIAAIVIVILCVGILSIYHLYCICRGQTTIEGRERTKVKRLIRRRKIAPIQFPFDVGIYRNISAVLGSNPLLWMWPQRMGGDGLSFPVRRHTGELALQRLFSCGN